MIKTNSDICNSCKYGKYLVGFGGDEYYCDYYLMTFKKRNCKVGECDKYEKREGDYYVNVRKISKSI